MSVIPGSISDYLKNELNVNQIQARNVSGGSINRASKLNTKNGTFFLKWNSEAPEDFFEKESEGLKLLRNADSDVVVPKVISYSGRVDDRPGFLLMEFVEEGSGSGENSFNFGQELARMHNNISDQFGLTGDNYIGSLPQSNNFHQEWLSFFIKERINPQIKMALNSGKVDHKTVQKWEKLSQNLDRYIPPCKPSLLHGDLWSGNYMFNKSGQAALIDPAVYYGHPEMDLAFSKMFGGFSGRFYDGYESVNRLEPNFSERVDIYNLYPLLVHVNLFGGHYISSLKQTLNRY